MSFHLYFTAGCHLCDLAEQVIADYNHLPTQSQVDYKKIDIADDDHLVSLYGVSIPVLESTQSKVCLNWPFDVESLTDFIATL